jgi:hypothetical protein
MDTMGEHHLVLAYAATILIHLVYVTFVAVKYRAAKKAESK